MHKKKKTKRKKERTVGRQMLAFHHFSCRLHVYAAYHIGFSMKPFSAWCLYKCLSYIFLGFVAWTENIVRTKLDWLHIIKFFNPVSKFCPRFNFFYNQCLVLRRCKMLFLVSSLCLLYEGKLVWHANVQALQLNLWTCLFLFWHVYKWEFRKLCFISCIFFMMYFFCDAQANRS